VILLEANHDWIHLRL
jgi:hypothetical protein